jgi:hypothetical membrane protein
VNNKVKTWSFIVIAGIVVYIAIDILLAFLRPDYSILHNAESDYGRGPYFWLMDINFLVRCLLSLALVKAIWAAFPKDGAIKKALYWLVSWAVASGLLAFFADNPYGYPHLRSGSVHLLLAFVAFISAVVGMILLDGRFRNVQSWHKIAGLLIGVTILAILSILLLNLTGFKPDKSGGLFERVFLGSVLAWEGIVAIKIISISNAFKKPQPSTSRKQK